MSDISVVSIEGPVINVAEATVGLQGPPGPQGPAGAPGVSPTGADLHATHLQAVASAVWTIEHNLGKRPSVVVIDSAGDQVEGMVAYLDANNLMITFSAAFGGEAYLN
jgi:hypothetical protein